MGGATRGTGELIAAAVRRVRERCGHRRRQCDHRRRRRGARGARGGGRRPGVLEVVCDVRTPWEDAPRVFGPQKGADEVMVAGSRRASKLAEMAPRDPRGEPMTGCAGGLSGGLWAFRGATLVPGAAYVLDAIGFDVRMRESVLVVTGEGKLDAQTLAGRPLASWRPGAGTPGCPATRWWARMSSTAIGTQSASPASARRRRPRAAASGRPRARQRSATRPYGAFVAPSSFARGALRRGDASASSCPAACS